MRKRFVVAVQFLPADEKIFIEYLKEFGIGWWHRVPNFWLLTTKKEQVDASTIRAKIRDIGPSAPTCLVMEISEDADWAGTFATGTTGTFDWLKGQWAES